MTELKRENLELEGSQERSLVIPAASILEVTDIPRGAVVKIEGIGSKTNNFYNCTSRGGTAVAPDFRARIEEMGVGKGYRVETTEGWKAGRPF